MKALLLSFLLATASLLQAGDHIELGSLTTQSGLRVSCLYLIKEGQDTEVHLIFPDGRDIEVTVQAGTSPRTMDKELQEIADQQKP
jgi:hypothetical protein